MGNPEGKWGGGGGGGGYCFLEKMENPGRWEGSLVNFPPWWGYGYFLELHNVSKEKFCGGSSLNVSFRILMIACENQQWHMRIIVALLSINTVITE